jgi:hypothetical protein
MLVAVAGVAAAGPFEDGRAALDRGDYVTAYRLLRPLAEQGDVRAQNDLGSMYQDGKGVPQNYTGAMKWYRRAAEQNYATSQFNVGLMYEHGIGVPQNYPEAAKWLGRAAEQGNATAQATLGFLYRAGFGVPENHDEALRLFRLSAEQGSAIGQGHLGIAYAYGEIVPQDYIQAYMWLSLAASRANDHDVEADAIKNLNLVASKMSRAQIAEAQELARRWRPQSPKIARVEQPTTPPIQNPSWLAPPQTGVRLKKFGGTFVVPVEINSAMTLDFTVDSGAADVTVPLDVFSTLRRQGTIADADIIDEQIYKGWDGSTQKTFTFAIRSLKVGNIVVENVRGGVAPLQGSLLLGQSFLERFKSWSIDNTNHILLLEPR